MNLGRAIIRKLTPGQSASEKGVTYTRLKGDGRWSINVMVNRVRHHEVIGLESEGFTYTQARERVLELRARKREKIHGVRRTSKRTITLSQAATEYLSHLEQTGGKDIAKKQQRLGTNIIPALGGIPLASMTTTDLKRYAKSRQDAGASPATVNREFAVISHLFRTASDPDGMAIIDAAPCRIPRLSEPKGKTAFLTGEQAAALLSAAGADQNPHVLTFVMVGLHTGMRYSPILRIRVEDLDLDRRCIWIDKDKAGEREQPITDALAEYLRAILRTHDSAWLFPSTKSKTGYANNVRAAWRRAVAAAGLGSVITPHTMRHTMATQAAHAGVDAATLQVLGGWKTRRMAERYSHSDNVAQAMQKLQNRYTITPELQQNAQKDA